MIFNNEELIEIPDFAGYYITKTGKVYSTLAPGCRNRYDLSKRIEPKELNYRFTNTGYCRVYMRRESTNKREDVYVHRIVAEMFILNPKHLSDVNHKDSNPSNNNVNNLEWLSHADNLQYGFEHGNKARDNKGRFTHK